MEIYDQLEMLSGHLDVISKMGPYVQSWKDICRQYADALNRGPIRRSTGFTLHDFDSHCSNIYTILNQMLKAELKKEEITKEELFILNVAVLMHDYSMTLENFNRDEHSRQSAEKLKEFYNRDAIWKQININIKDIIPYIIEAHSDIKGKNAAKTMENPNLNDTMSGQYDVVRGRYLAACLRLADELDLSRERVGKYYNDLPQLDEADEEQRESLKHWKRLMYIQKVDFSGAIIYITINDEYIQTLESIQKKEALEEIRKVREHAQATLQYLNEIEFNIAKVRIRYTDIAWHESQIYTTEELENSTIIEDDNNKNNTKTVVEEKRSLHIEKQNKYENIKTEQHEQGEKEDNTNSSNKKESKGKEARYTWGTVPVVSIELERKITQYILDNKLIYQGHYRMNRNFCGKDWIDVRPLLQDKIMGKNIADAIAENIKENYKKIVPDNTIIVGISMNGNIIASRVAYRLHLPFTYVLAGECGSIDERKADFENYDNIIMVTGVISTYDSISYIIKENKIEDKVSYIYTVLFRKIHDALIEKYEQLNKKVHAINTIFNANIIQKRDCMLEKNGRCIAENLLAFQQVVDEQGNWKKSLRLVYGNSKRVFVNNAIGCNAHCSYCYLAGLIGEQEKVWKYSHIDALEQLRSMGEFQLGKEGTIISLGCYSECWSEENREETKKLICKLAASENPIQMATKKWIDPKDLKEIDSYLQYENQLTIYISIPTISESEKIEKDTDTPMQRMQNFKANGKFNNCNFVLYIKPVLKGVTINDLNEYVNIMKQYHVPCVVGDYLTYNEEGKWTKDMVGEGYLREEKVDDADKIIERLKQEGRVFRHSMEVIESWRRMSSE